MLVIKIPGEEYYDEIDEVFVYGKDQILRLEHSLVSLSKWESKFHKPFFSKKEKTREETLEYIKCMTITQNVNPEVYYRITNENISQIDKYIDDSMTATTFREDKTAKRNNEIITAEIIYYWMVSLNIPFECEKWHLNRLLTLIKVCSIKNAPAKKMSRRELVEQRKALNASRKARLNSKG